MLVSKSNTFSSNSTGVTSSSSVRRPESKDNNLMKRVLPNTNSKTISKDVKNSQSSVSLASNKCDTLNSNVSTTKANVLNAKTINVVNDGSNLVCVARYALSMNSRVKRALFTSPVVAKSSTDISKITRNPSKNGQTRTRETEEHKRSQRLKAKAKKSQP
ncbi:hypothetical protein Tco_0946729 [Tanacetum coccineum]